MRITKNHVFGLITLLLCWLTAEAAGYVLIRVKKGAWPYTFAMENFYAVPRLYMTDHPFLPYLATKGVASERIRFNSLGDRGKEPDDPKRRVRIVCYGGSTTFDGAHDWDETWPGLLQAALGEEMYEVINAAQNGATSADTFVNLSLIHSDLKPDFVLVYHGTNDLESSFFPGFRSDYAHRRRDIGGEPYPFFRRLPKFFNLSALYVIARWELVGPRGELHALYSRPGKAYDFKNGPFGLPTFERNLRQIHAIAEVNGGKTVLGTFQYYRPLADKHLGEEFGAAWERGIRAENEIIRKLAAQVPGIHLAEIAGSFEPGPEHMTDFCHLTTEGNRLIAEAFLAAIRKAGS